MVKNIKISNVFSTSSTAVLDQVCAAIADNDQRRFDLLLPQIDDLDVDNNRILRDCITHDRFSMAKKLFMRGAASTILLIQFKESSERAHRIYMDAPSSNDRAELSAYREVKHLYETLETWKTTFEKDVLPALSLQKLEDLQNQITALRQDIAEMITPARSVIAKKTATPTT